MCSAAAATLPSAIAESLIPSLDVRNVVGILERVPDPADCCQHVPQRGSVRPYRGPISASVSASRSTPLTGIDSATHSFLIELGEGQDVLAVAQADLIDPTRSEEVPLVCHESALDTHRRDNFRQGSTGSSGSLARLQGVSAPRRPAHKPAGEIVSFRGDEV